MYTDKAKLSSKKWYRRITKLVYFGLQLDSILSHTKPAHCLTRYKSRSNTRPDLPSTTRSPNLFPRFVMLTNLSSASVPCVVRSPPRSLFFIRSWNSPLRNFLILLLSLLSWGQLFSGAVFGKTQPTFFAYIFQHNFLYLSQRAGPSGHAV